MKSPQRLLLDRDGFQPRVVDLVSAVVSVAMIGMALWLSWR
jgi:hypothetical protein